eukprot:4626191-Pyramimonas_sp.AAC.1
MSGSSTCSRAWKTRGFPTFVTNNDSVAPFDRSLARCSQTIPEKAGAVGKRPTVQRPWVTSPSSAIARRRPGAGATQRPAVLLHHPTLTCNP